MELVMSKDKETKGAIRYSDGDNHNLYLRKEEAVQLGKPDHILVTITVMTKK